MMRRRVTVTVAVSVLLAACQPTFRPGPFPVVDPTTGRPVAEVDSPETARRDGVAHVTVVTCTGPDGWPVTMSLATADTVGWAPGTVCGPGLVDRG